MCVKDRQFVATFRIKTGSGKTDYSLLFLNQCECFFKQIKIGKIKNVAAHFTKKDLNRVMVKS